MSDRIECHHCGELILKSARVCRHCKGSALYDVVLAKAIGDDRKAYRSARELEASNLVELEFLDIKKRIDDAPGTLVGGVTAQQAEELVFLLVSNDVLIGEIRPHEPSAPPPFVRGRSWTRAPILWVVGALAAVVVMTVFTTIGGDDDGEDGRVATAQSIAEQVVGSTVRLKSGDSYGTGFFITDEIVVTNAHVIGSRRSDVEVTFESGLRARGFPLERDEWHDVALVRVTGADATPLPVADSATLDRGDPVFFVGSPRGLDFTFSRGIVSHPARVIRGISYLQVDAAINPGNSGGPLLNDRGEVVGLVTMVVGIGSSLGLALPINYLHGESELGRVEGVASLDSPAWQDLLENAVGQNRIEIDEFRAHEGRIEILAAGLSEHGGIRVIVTQWNRSRPDAVGLEFHLDDDEITLCRPTGTVERWTGNLSRDDLEELDPRFVMWLERNRLMHKLYLGQALLDMRGCPGPLRLLRSTLRLESFDGFVTEKKVGAR